MKALVTGGAGFIGSHICDLLVSRGHDVIVLDDLSKGGNTPKSCQFFNADIRDEQKLIELSKGCSAIFHQAAIADIPLSIKDPKLVNSVNVEGTLSVLEAARKNNCRVIFASSSSIYGAAAPPIKETAEPDPKTPYAVTKLVCEHYLRNYSELYGLKCVALRYFNVYGPRQSAGPVIASFCFSAAKGQPLLIEGSGEQVRDFVYVEDVAEANLLSLKTSKSFLAVNIGTGKGTSLNELAKAIGGKTEKKPARQGDISISMADISLAKKELGWSPKISLKDGLSKTIAWARSSA